ncbi:MAG TPA: hypothetical protein H9786_03920 [Candidatus Brachybacterium merdavium]|uniref:Uncharacterized protein n=1 Tax=Candidatus Brachybacterium merdavium TaxID=2838513 RepID=A0A9D2RNB9_9MICO|nr:hypothetical protein [Candidatus Brachybacterium merdavium]
MTDSPYGPQASHRLDGDVPESGAHPPAVSGQIVPAGAYDPAGRSQDPLSPGRADAPAPGAGYGAPTNIYVVQAPKSVGVAFVLTFFFGCFGMFYSTVTGALVMIAVATGLVVIALVLSFLLTMATLGFGAFTVGLAPFVGLLTWPVSIIWGCLAASNHNEKLRAQAQQAQQAAQATYRPGY